MGGGTLLDKPILCPYVFVLVYFAIVSPTKMLAAELEGLTPRPLLLYILYDFTYLVK